MSDRVHKKDVRKSDNGRGQPQAGPAEKPQNKGKPDKGKGPANPKGGKTEQSSVDGTSSGSNRKDERGRGKGKGRGPNPHAAAARERWQCCQYVQQYWDALRARHPASTLIDVGGHGNRVSGASWALHPHVTSADAGHDLLVPGCHHAVADRCEHVKHYDLAVLVNSQYYLTFEEMLCVVDFADEVYVIGHLFHGTKGTIAGIDWSVVDGNVEMRPPGGELYRHPPCTMDFGPLISVTTVITRGDTYVWKLVRSSATEDIPVAGKPEPAPVMRAFTINDRGVIRVGGGRLKLSNFFRRRTTVELDPKLVKDLLVVKTMTREKDAAFAAAAVVRTYAKKHEKLTPVEAENLIAYAPLVVDEAAARTEKLRVRAMSYLWMFHRTPKPTKLPKYQRFSDRCLLFRETPKAIRPGAKLILGYVSCKPRHGHMILGPHYAIPGQPAYVLRNCSHNQELGVRTRLLMHQLAPEPSTNEIFQLKRFLASYGDRLRACILVPALSEYIARMKPQRRMMMNRDLVGVAAQKRAATIFVKGEVGTKPIEEIDPRIIASPSSAMFGDMGPQTYAFQHAFAYSTRDADMVFVSGMDAEQIGSVWQRISFGRSAVTFDVKRMDAHARASIITTIYDFIEEVTGAQWEHDGWVERFGFTREGLMFALMGNVLSGECGTNLIDAIIVMCIAHVTSIEVGVGVTGLFGGDDSTIAVDNSSILSFRDRMVVVASRFGFVLTGGQIFTDPLDADFYSGLFWPIGGSRRVLGPMLGKFVVKGYMTRRDVKDEHALKELHARAIGYRHLVAPVPVLKQMNDRILHLTAEHQSETHRQAHYRTPHKAVSLGTKFWDVVPDQAIDFLCDRYNSSPAEIADVLDEVSRMQLDTVLTRDFWTRCVERDC